MFLTFSPWGRSLSRPPQTPCESVSGCSVPPPSPSEASCRQSLPPTRRRPAGFRCCTTPQSGAVRWLRLLHLLRCAGSGSCCPKLQNCCKRPHRLSCPRPPRPKLLLRLQSSVHTTQGERADLCPPRVMCPGSGTQSPKDSDFCPGRCRRRHWGA